MVLNFRILDATEEAIVKAWLRHTRGRSRSTIVELMAQDLRRPDQRRIEELVPSPRRPNGEVGQSVAQGFAKPPT